MRNSYLAKIWKGVLSLSRKRNEVIFKTPYVSVWVPLKIKHETRVGRRMQEVYQGGDIRKWASGKSKTGTQEPMNYTKLRLCATRLTPARNPLKKILERKKTGIIIHQLQNLLGRQPLTPQHFPDHSQLARESSSTFFS